MTSENQTDENLEWDAKAESIRAGDSLYLLTPAVVSSGSIISGPPLQAQVGRYVTVAATEFDNRARTMRLELVGGEILAMDGDSRVNVWRK
jgi:hypothetical protein